MACEKEAQVVQKLQEQLTDLKDQLQGATGGQLHSLAGQIQQVTVKLGAAEAALKACQEAKAIFRGISGKIKHLRVNDSASNPTYGPSGDTLDTEVVVVVDSSDEYFGFDIKPGPDLPSRISMLSIIREAYLNNLTIGLGYYIEDGKKAGTIVRVDLER
jgi:hypothetical protein